MVKFKIRNGINHINKLDFLKAYPPTQIKAFKAKTIKNSFIVTSLVLFTPNQVISKLNIRLRTPTPPPSKESKSSRNFTPKTPATEKELHQQTLSIKALLHTRSRSPSSPSDCTLNQLIKGFRLTIQSTILLANKNKELHTANKKQKQKRARSRKQILAETGLSV